MTYRTLTTEMPEEYADRMIVSYSKAAATTSSPFIAGWYARECVRIARYVGLVDA